MKASGWAPLPAAASADEAQEEHARDATKDTTPKMGMCERSREEKAVVCLSFGCGTCGHGVAGDSEGGGSRSEVGRREEGVVVEGGECHHLRGEVKQWGGGVTADGKECWGGWLDHLDSVGYELATCAEWVGGEEMQEGVGEGGGGGSGRSGPGGGCHAPPLHQGGDVIVSSNMEGRDVSARIGRERVFLAARWLIDRECV